jgi:putative inorganic carbon (hco3(-)) transporter
MSSASLPTTQYGRVGRHRLMSCPRPYTHGWLWLLVGAMIVVALVGLLFAEGVISYEQSGTGIVAAAIVLALVSIAFWLKSPWFSLLGWVAALSIQYEILPDFRLGLSDLFVPGLALTLLFTTTKKGEETRRQRSPLPALIVVFVTVFISLGNTMAYLNLGTIPRWTWANKDIGLLDLVICFFAITRLVDRREKLHRIVRVVVLSGSVLNIFALVGGVARYFFGIPNVMMYDTATPRLAGLMVDPNAYGGFILCVLLIQLALLFGKSTLLRLPKWAQRVNVALLGVACLMTISRSSLLGLGGGLLALVIFYRGRATVWLVSLALAVVLTIVAVAYWPGFSPDLADDFWNLAFSGTTFGHRMDANKVALDMLRKSPTNPITGIGVGTFLARSGQKLEFELIIHNEFLWLLAETGILGLCLFCAIIVRSLRNCLSAARSRCAESPIAVGVICSIVSMVVWMQGVEGLGQRHLWLLLALSEVSYRLHPKNSGPRTQKRSRTLGACNGLVA